MPLCAVAVAVENDTPVLVDDVFEQLLDRFVQLVRTGFFQLGCQKVNRFSHDDVQCEDRRANGLACADCTELEPVPSKGEGAGPVAVARVLWQGWQHVNPAQEFGVQAHCAYDCAAEYQKLSIGVWRVTRIEQVALSRIPQ